MTLSRCIAGLHHDFSGSLNLDGEPLAASSFKRSKEQRRRVQYIFQNPYESLNPRRTVEELILQPVTAVRGNMRNGKEIVATALERASRVAIARALARARRADLRRDHLGPGRVSVQSSLVDLLRSLQTEMGLTCCSSPHNIALVRNIARQVAVLERGRIVEFGNVEDVFANPQHTYTRSLIQNTPNFQLSGRLHPAGAGGAPVAPDGPDCCR